MAGETTRTRQLEDARVDAQERSEMKITDPCILLADAAILGSCTTVLEDSTKTALRNGTKMANEAFETFDGAYRKMLAREVDVEARAKKHVSALKDKANQVAEALGRINKLAGPDFEDKLVRLERFANAVETLDRLNRGGKLVDVANAIRGLSA